VWKGHTIEGYYDTLANRVLVCPSQGGRNHDEGCIGTEIVIAVS
jgi:hypothetical protein